MYLIQSLPDTPLDIIGDVHGELSALLRLLAMLGYDTHGYHPQKRRLVFVGDLIDRGPNSYGVVRLVQAMVESGQAQCILGNHEINLLIDDVKDGSGWFFSERYEADLVNYAPFKRIAIKQREAIRQFLDTLPVALERDDIRVIHAAWHPGSIDKIRKVNPQSVAQQYQIWDQEAQSAARTSGLYDRYLAEKERWTVELESKQNPPPFLHAIAEYEAAQQTVNPLKVLTSGIEVPAETAFFAGNRWRFSDRTRWWNDYTDATPVVIGHYWRVLNPRKSANTPRYTRLFDGVKPTAWHGRLNNVFCIDYSAGARWRDRKQQLAPENSRFRLAALQWPENRIVFDSGEILPALNLQTHTK